MLTNLTAAECQMTGAPVCGLYFGFILLVLVVVLQAYLEALSDRLIGVYLRGSLPRGLALEGVSDIDMLGATA